MHKQGEGGLAKLASNGLAPPPTDEDVTSTSSGASKKVPCTSTDTNKVVSHYFIKVVKLLCIILQLLTKITKKLLILKVQFIVLEKSGFLKIKL